VQHERIQPVSRDLPPVIVQLQVVKAAQQQPSIDIGATRICLPVIDVVRFTI
jgi:hypothetical protein